MQTNSYILTLEVCMLSCVKAFARSIAEAIDKIIKILENNISALCPTQVETIEPDSLNLPLWIIAALLQNLMQIVIIDEKSNTFC